MAELNLEFYEELMTRRQEILDELDDEDTRSDEAGRLLKALNSINKALGLEETVQDDLIAEWERELDAGRIPDLNKR